MCSGVTGVLATVEESASCVKNATLAETENFNEDAPKTDAPQANAMRERRFRVRTMVS
ncbi:hypothetical protein HMPREF9440_00714 [Sutterella parvirubra YIT 11816]|uniref:Uncharacterized protein n=1 Tax=Sutterella parvirubra YIT 11816 TaxID=762967 RepID=H3KDA5_9BURK|nr:hypothetical protein HMPREF9440_00714 [Sutterella parvirubra YIT 11816]